jgi:hypothetical protein
LLNCFRNIACRPGVLLGGKKYSDGGTGPFEKCLFAVDGGVFGTDRVRVEINASLMLEYKKSVIDGK